MTGKWGSGVVRPEAFFFSSSTVDLELLSDLNNNNNTYMALIRMRSKRFTSIVLQYNLEI